MVSFLLAVNPCWEVPHLILRCLLSSSTMPGRELAKDGQMDEWEIGSSLLLPSSLLGSKQTVMSVQYCDSYSQKIHSRGLGESRRGLGVLRA